MRIKKLDSEALSAWVDGLIRKQPVIGIQADGDRFAFKPLERAADLRLDYDVSKLPPKKFFQPPTETLLRFDKAGRYESVIPKDKFVLFGVHPYDMVALSQMARAFSMINCDTHYMTRLQNATIVVCDVQTASPNGFSGCMNAATVQEGHDVLLTKVGDDYVVEAKTTKGKALMRDLARAPAADKQSLARREQVWECNRRLLRRHDLKPALQDIPALLEKSYDHPVWERRAKLCHSCGSCVIVCPTCLCFDVRDDVDWDLKGGRRSRTWDGCMLTSFATVAGGHNFRKNRAERYRHRYYRKGKYLAEKIGAIACVGCGRCITACTTQIANPVEVYNSLLEWR